MHFKADISIRGNAHQGELQIGSRPKSPSEEGVFQRGLLDIDHIGVRAKILADAPAAGGAARRVYRGFRVRAARTARVRKTRIKRFPFHGRKPP